MNHLRLQWKIAEAQRAESQLRDTSDPLRNIATNVPGAIIRYIVRTDGTDAFLYVSDQSASLWELSPAAAISDPQSIWSMTLSDDLPVVPLGGEISRLVAAGVCEYLPKPFSTHALLTTLARTLHR